MSQQATVQDLNADAQSCAAWIARFLKARGVDRVFGLQGGHIQPIWDHCARLGIRIVDVRDEGAAVHMAHAHAELTGEVGVCMATAGPGVTNCVTGIANASLARVPVLLIGGCTSRPQANLGPLQDIPHVDILRPVTRQSRTARVADQVIRDLDEAWARAMGDLAEPGPVYIEIPTDVLRAHVPPQLVLDDWMAPKAPRRLPPDPAGVAKAVDVLWGAKRPLVVSGRGARTAGPELVRLLDALGAVYLDTQESRGLVPADHPATVGAMRAAAMTEADVVLVIGRKLDYQLGYGSPAVFPNARFVRIADTAGELVDNRRGEPELLATPALALSAIVDAAGNRAPALDRAWAEDLRARHVTRSTGGSVPQTGEDGRVHPAAIFAAIRQVASPDYIAVADGGDLLSFARVGLEARTYLDAGAFGCLGIGVPYATAASLAFPDRQVICVTGDGAFGINAMEIDTAVRHGAKPVIIVSNNAAWNIERYDQEFNYGGRVVGTLLADSDYAAMARALGAHGERVERAEDLAPAIARALAADAPALIDVTTSQVAVSSDARKGLGFVPDYQPLTAWDDAERRRRGETV
ncbi:thiamine pyrophosphate-binding protein [Methylobacterium terricola]|uniref:Thiamine pyrophosphate-binding protein n=1 Tax=Methylobacterium terricola TaxID=2583531 RepID=A0A5C4LF15_9HYPH|nr:thiamine pyrophosphate-binding protein [Methylobacterium terricola]TNC12080.1 thiamine pyrophosphate-binding protein [Methylobacterium terricola]